MSMIRVRPQSSELIRGESCVVPITLELTDAVKVRGLHALFHGAEETKATYSTYNAATKSTQTHTAIQHFDIVKREYLLRGSEKKGFFGNLADGLATIMGGGEHELLPPGEYPFEIQFDVPQDAPSTFKGSKCRIFYELSVQVDIPLGFDLKTNFSFNMSGETEPPSSNSVRTRYPEDQGRGLFDAWFGPDLSAEAALSENVFRPGDLIEGIFQIQAPETLECRSISVRLVGIEKTHAHGHDDSHTHQGPPTVVAKPGTIEPSFTQNFSVQAAYDWPVVPSGEQFSIDCYLQIELDVPWAKDPKIRVPVILLPK